MTGDVLSGFTFDAQRVLAKAQREARVRNHSVVTPEHLTLVLIGESRGAVGELLRAAGVDNESIKEGVDARLFLIEPNPKSTTKLGKPVLGVLSQALEEARGANQDNADCVHLLLALAGSRSPVSDLFRRWGATRDRLVEALSKKESSGNVGESKLGDAAVDDGSEDYLAKYGRDITSFAEEGLLDPVIGRKTELRRILQVLGRRTKNNPVLVGEPGVGKSAIVAGLAQMVAQGRVPKALKKLRIVNLELGSILAGAKFRGDFEERLRGIIEQVRRSKGRVLLFIDEIHGLVGAGQSGGGGMDASRLIKPALARGELRCIGSTTREDYRTYLEKDKSLERRLEPIFVEEPDDLDALAILKGVRPSYEVHHGVRIQDEALLAAVRLSRRYVTQRCLPDKAINVMDEAASRLRVELDGEPDELIDLDVELARLRLVLDSGGVTQVDKERAKDQLGELKQKREGMVEQWREEVACIEAARKARAELQSLERSHQKALSLGDVDTMTELKDVSIPKAEEEIRTLEERLSAPDFTPRLLSDLVTASEVAQVVAVWTGVPVDDMLASERDRLRIMEDILERRVKGQPEGIRKLSAAIRRARVGLKDPKRPIGSFLFLGPTGVGKTELAKALAEFLFHDENSIIRLDMSEFMEKQTASRLVGAAPGYVGYESGGQLTESVRRRPYSLVLFDEIEKAHVDVFDLLLQVLDDGRLTDSSGRTVDMSNTVIVMTSNAGARRILESAGDIEAIEETVKAELLKTFRPEFLNRIDETIIFNPLGKKQLGEIAGLMLSRVGYLLRQKGFLMRVNDSMQEAIVEAGWDPAFGARPLRRAVQRMLIDPLAVYILDHDPEIGATLVADWVEDDTGGRVDIHIDGDHTEPKEKK